MNLQRSLKKMTRPFTLDASVKDRFFDRKRVIDALVAGDRKRLSRIGAFVRQRARSILGRRVGYGVVSKPGRPPRVHSSDPYANLKRILFALDSTGLSSVVIGPGLVSSTARRLRSNRQTVPELLEFGGTSLISVGGVTRRSTYEPRPFMGPALEAEIRAGTILRQWSDVPLRRAA